MLFAQVTKNMRKLVLVMLLLTALVFALPAMAEEQINFTLSVEPSSLTAPGPVTVSVRVANVSDADMTEPVLLYDPDGQIVTTFGDGGQALIKKGEFVSAQHTYHVSQAQLDDGKLTYMISYNAMDESGNVTVKSLSASADLAFTGTRTELTVNRTIDPEVVRKGKNVTVMYELYNAGNVEIKNIRVRENSSVSGSSQTVEKLAPGERKTLQFTAAMRDQDMVSEGKVTYKAGEESFTQELPAVTIARAVPGLELDNILSAEKTSIETGETATLVLTIKNKGNITYSNISVTDQKYGEIFTNLTLGPGETLVKEKQFTLNETTNFKYTVVLPDNTGTTNTVSSNEVKVSVYDPSQVMHLSVMAETVNTTVPRIPADVRFTVTVTNNSSMVAENVSIYHGDTFVYTIDKLEPSRSQSITREFTLSQAGKYRFTAKVKDALDNTVAFDSNEIHISYAAPTATPTMAPVVTVAPLVTVTVAPIEVLEPVTTQMNEYLRIAAMVFGALFVVAFALFVPSTIVRSKRRKLAKKREDYIILSDKRDYTKKASSAPAVEEAPAVEAPAAKPSDEILKDAAPAAPITQQGDDAGVYRLTREASMVAPEAPAQEEKAEPAAAPKRNRRSGRKSVETPSEDE